MGMGFAPTWLHQVSPLLHKTTLTTGPEVMIEAEAEAKILASRPVWPRGFNISGFISEFSFS